MIRLPIHGGAPITAVLLALLSGGCSDSGSDGSVDRAVVTLASLEVEGATLESSFDPDDLDYYAAARHLNARISVIARPTDPEATVLIDGSVADSGAMVSRDLMPGPNTVEIDVVNGDLQRTYTLTVDRADFEADAWLLATPPMRDRSVGTSLSGDEQTLLAGTPFDSGNARGVNAIPVDQSLTNSGAAYVFARDSAGTW